MALMHQWPSYLSRGPGADRCTYAPDVPLNEHERAVLDTACAAVPPPAVVPAVGTDSDYPDYVSNLLLTVLDLQLHNKIVYNAYQHYRIDLWGEIRTLDDLESALERFPDDPDGNRPAATYLWGYQYGNQLGWLRGLVAWVRRHGLVDQDALRAWAYGSDYQWDFAGQVRNLGPAAYCWLVMRLGVDTVKSDAWLCGFVKRVLGRDLDDVQLVIEVKDAAHRVGRLARELDAGIWESERGGPGAI